MVNVLYYRMVTILWLIHIVTKFGGPMMSVAVSIEVNVVNLVVTVIITTKFTTFTSLGTATDIVGSQNPLPCAKFQVFIYCRSSQVMVD